MRKQKRFIISTASKSALQKRVRLLTRQNAYFCGKLNAMVPLEIPIVLEQDMRAGMTLVARVSKPFRVNRGNTLYPF